MAAAGALVAAAAVQPAAAHSLPLGDGKVKTQPRAGNIYSCQTSFGGGGAHRVGDWVDGDSWNPDEKPVVSGDVDWPNARIDVTRQGDTRIVSANNLPLHETGTFPIPRSDEAYAYDRNPNSIRAQDILLRLPAEPERADSPTCVPMGMIGFALSGVAIYNALDAMGRDAPAYEIQDKCNGHPQRSGQYHYHDWSGCLTDNRSQPGSHSDLVGYALDGFGFYGLHGENGTEMTNADLDACHGHVHEVMWDGALKEIYHYHMTREYPYTIGCFAGPVEASARHLSRALDGEGGGPGQRAGARRPGPPPGSGPGRGPGWPDDPFARRFDR
jgi:hypothetical protein